MAAYNMKPRAAKNQFVVGIGSRVYVNWVQPLGQPARPVPMVDAAGQVLTNDLVDGQEVEVLSWRPRSRDGLAYQVRRLSDGTEWWIGATYLRRLPVAPPPITGSDASQPPGGLK